MAMKNNEVERVVIRSAHGAHVVAFGPEIDARVERRIAVAFGAGRCAVTGEIDIRGLAA